MKKALHIIWMLFVFMMGATAQEIKPLPEAPQPKKTLDQRLSERYPDLLKLDEKEQKWTDAAKTPGMIMAAAMIVGTSIGDIHSSNECIERKGCKEWNPLMRTSPAGRWALGLSVNGFVWAYSVHHKQKGHGVDVMIISTVAFAAHTLSWSHNR